VEPIGFKIANQPRSITIRTFRWVRIDSFPGYARSQTVFTWLPPEGLSMVRAVVARSYETSTGFLLRDILLICGRDSLPKRLPISFSTRRQSIMRITMTCY